MRWMSDRDGGPWYGFVRVDDARTEMVWALEKDKDARSPAEEARRWSLEFNYEDVPENEDAVHQADWRRRMALAHPAAVAIVVMESMRNREEKRSGE